MLKAPGRELRRVGMFLAVVGLAACDVQPDREEPVPEVIAGTIAPNPTPDPAPTPAAGGSASTLDDDIDAGAAATGSTRRSAAPVPELPVAGPAPAGPDGGATPTGMVAPVAVTQPVTTAPDTVAASASSPQQTRVQRSSGDRLAIGTAGFSADSSIVEPGGFTTLSLLAADYSFCEISADTAAFAPVVVYATQVADQSVVLANVASAPLLEPEQNYRATCAGNAGTIELEVRITPPQPEIVSFEVSATEVDLDAQVEVSWSTRNVVECDLGGLLADPLEAAAEVSGAATVPLGEARVDLTLTCTSPAGAVAQATRSVDVRPPEILYFVAENLTVDPDEPVRLSWATRNTDRCTGLDPDLPITVFAGSLPTAFGNGTDAGTFMVVPHRTRNRTLSLTCTGAAGHAAAIAVLAIDLEGLVISWTPPDHLSNGAALDGTDVSHYLVYRSADADGTYAPNPVQVPATGAEVESVVVDLPPGTWYLAVTAVLLDGSESAFSAEVSVTVSASGRSQQ